MSALRPDDTGYDDELTRSEQEEMFGRLVYPENSVINSENFRNSSNFAQNLQISKKEQRTISEFY